MGTLDPIVCSHIFAPRWTAPQASGGIDRGGPGIEAGSIRGHYLQQ